MFGRGDSVGFKTGSDPVLKPPLGHARRLILIAAVLLLLLTGSERARATRLDRAPTRSVPGVPGYNFATKNPDRLLNLLHAQQPRAVIDVGEATEQVFFSTWHSDSRRIDWHENWIQWGLGLIYEPCAHTQNPQRIAASGSGNCSERTQLLKSILERSGYQCRFVGLTGHVVLEVHTSDGWRIADADYGVAFPVGLNVLESSVGMNFIHPALQARGFSPATITQYAAWFQSAADNVILPIGSPLSPRLALVEAATDWLSWTLPVGLLVVTLTWRRRVWHSARGRLA